MCRDHQETDWPLWLEKKKGDDDYQGRRQALSLYVATAGESSGVVLSSRGPRCQDACDDGGCDGGGDAADDARVNNARQTRSLRLL